MAAQATLADLGSPAGAGGRLGRAGGARARRLRRAKSVALYAFLIAVSLPIILPYFWLVTIAFSAKTGVAETAVLWRSMARAGAGRHRLLARGDASRRTAARCWLGMAAVALVAAVAFALLVGPDLHLGNFIFLCGAGLRLGRALAHRRGQRRGAVPQCLARLRQLDPDRRRADGDRRHRRLARRLLSVALPVSRPRLDAALAAGAARLPGADADRADVPDALLDRAARHAVRRHPGARRVRAALRDLHHEGLLRRRAVGHRDERADRRRVAAAGVRQRGAAAGAGTAFSPSPSSPSSAAGRSTSSSSRS